ncbi:MAG: Gfo/Idh/MocA family oxidoreductase [Spirochaetales bacterium]|nr:Gfo/Idh/MocA family oxidoreductase [Spirochaetales bacterium]
MSKVINPSSPVTAALIGLGRIASLLEFDAKREKPASHAGALTQAGVSLIAGCDIDPERSQTFSQRWGVEALYTEAEQLLAEQSPDILVIATYPDTHAELLNLAFRHRIPVVICEKPLTDTLSTARQLERALEKSSTKVVVNHERRYARDYQRVKGIIVNQAFGRLCSVNAKLFMGRGRTPGEVLLWDGTHLVDILRYLTGEEGTEIQADGEVRQSGGSLWVRMRMGTVATAIEIATDRDHLVFELDLSFERGRIRIGNGLYEEWVGGESPLYEKMRSLLPVQVNTSDLYPTEYFLGMAKDAVRAFKEPSYQPVSSLRDGVAALETLDTILKRAGSSLARLSRL